MIPVKVDSITGQVTFQDIGRYHIHQGRFKSGLDTHNALRLMAAKQAQATDYQEQIIDIDQLADIKPDCVESSLLIFHMSRCGSTLLTRALAQSRVNVALGEPEVLNDLWAYHSGPSVSRVDSEWASAQSNSFKHMMRLMGRKRLESYRYFAVKFPSVYCAMMKSISQLYPSTPAIFIYRQPIEVLASLELRPSSMISHRDSLLSRAAVTNNRPRSDSATEYASKLLEISMQSALESDNKYLYFLNYSKLTSANLPIILADLGLTYSNNEMNKMQNQFSFYSKADNKNQPFVDDGQIKKEGISDEAKILCESGLDELYSRLSVSAKNLL